MIKPVRIASPAGRIFGTIRAPVNCRESGWRLSCQIIDAQAKLSKSEVAHCCFAVNALKMLSRAFSRVLNLFESYEIMAQTNNLKFKLGYFFNSQACCLISCFWVWHKRNKKSAGLYFAARGQRYTLEVVEIHL